MYVIEFEIKKLICICKNFVYFQLESITCFTFIFLIAFTKTKYTTLTNSKEKQL